MLNNPFATRYTDPELDKIWSKETWAGHIIDLWYAELKKLLPASNFIYDPFTIEQVLTRANILEQETHHELVSLLKAYSEHLTKPAQRLIHLGMTSSDCQDHADLLMIKASLQVILVQLSGLISSLANKTFEYAGTPILGRTHLQPAEPTTMGLRLAVPLEQLLSTLDQIQNMIESFPSKGIRGAVGTMANTLLSESKLHTKNVDMSHNLMVSGQTYPRQIDLRTGMLLSDIACTLHKLSFDMRIMATEPYVIRNSDGVGSSAMPGKINPQNWEKVTGLSRLMPDIFSGLWHMAASSMLERTLDDSSSRRVLLPQMFYVISECLRTSTKEIDRFAIDVEAAKNHVWDNWKAWIPSRLLAYEQCRPGIFNRMELHRNFARDLAEINTMEDFLLGWDYTVEDEFLFLQAAESLAKTVVSVANYVLKDLDKEGDM